MTITAADTTPRVWPACLSCYNNARLVGQWVDCTDAADVTLHQLHEGTGSLSAGCEEIWCLDTENIPVEHEMGLQAAEWGGVNHPGWPRALARTVRLGALRRLRR